jgi:alkanesulfonate monooxygenase SsuD/methylene tetrahydromethanopterin reductase-like flavin-dependent oxidoreductase (luciferase family)
MQIGLINELHGKTVNGIAQPSWESIRERAEVAERVGFDIFVFEDALMYRGDESTDGVWESMTIAGALAAATETIKLGQSVVNSPYRSPAMTAVMAETLNEISAGRYVLGIGAGNTPDSDYEAFGFPRDKRYSRFSEAIQIIHSLLKTGKVDFTGEFYQSKDAELVLRGPGSNGPEINIAAGGPRMLALVAKYGDAWNWWTWGETHDETTTRFAPLIKDLETATSDEGRDIASLRRTLDLYTVVPEGFPAEVPNMANPVAGDTESIAERILALGELGISEVRCDVFPRTIEALEAMAPIVEIVHS